MQAAGQRGDLRHCATRLVVNEQRQSGQVIGRSDQQVVLSFRQVAGSQIVPVDFRGDGQKSFGQFQIGLFQTEQQHALARLAGHGFGHVTHQRGLCPYSDELQG
jgi:hypothetical protein